MFPEKIEFDGKNIEPNPTTRCLTLSISKPMSYEETKKKKEKDFRLSPIQYPEPVQATEIIGKQKNLSSLLSTICIFLIFSFFAIFCPFFVIKYTFSTL